MVVVPLVVVVVVAVEVVVVVVAVVVDLKFNNLRIFNPKLTGQCKAIQTIHVDVVNINVSAIQG